ncbi:histone-lysine N-methyltransferase SETMAR [Trichonephila clavipes]|nr:histone-lysine N-methyltransferase SETMAR [Trichonephila clavipes]
MNSKKGSNASVACKNLCAVFGKDIVNFRTCQRRLSKFRSGDLSLQESDRSGRPSKIDNDVLRYMLENNPHLTSQEIAEEFGIHHTAVGNHIKSLGFVLKRSVWVPHELTEKNLSDRPHFGVVCTRSDWTATEWNQVVFSDKSRFSLGINDNDVRVGRPLGQHLNPAFTVQWHTAPTINARVQSAIANEKVSSLILIHAIIAKRTAYWTVYEFDDYAVALLKQLRNEMSQDMIRDLYTSMLDITIQRTLTEEIAHQGTKASIHL